MRLLDSSAITGSTSPPMVVRGRVALAVLFLGSAGVHFVLVATNPEAYRPFADQAVVSFVQTTWRDVFMADPEAWGLTVALGEVVLAAALLMGGRWRRAGYVGVIAFTLALTLFGWGFWLWSGPALALIVPLALADSRPLRWP
jgi:hypothetical protein